MARRAIAVRVDEEGTLHADLGELPRATRARAASAVRAVLRAVAAAEGPKGENLSDKEWIAAWAPELERRVRDVREGRAKLVPLDVALQRMRVAARGTR